MQRIIGKFLLLWGIVFFAMSCSDDFLDSPQLRTTRSAPTAIYLTPTTVYMEHTVTVTDAGNAAYSVGLCPKWITFRYLKGSFKDNSVVLKFTVQNVSASFEPGTYESVLSLTIENIGAYRIPVYFVNE